MRLRPAGRPHRFFPSWSLIPAIAVAPSDPDAVAPAMKRAQKLGAKVITFDAATAKQYYAKAYEVGWENAIKASPQYGPQMRKLFSK